MYSFPYSIPVYPVPYQMVSTPVHLSRDSLPVSKTRKSRTCVGLDREKRLPEKGHTRHSIKWENPRLIWNFVASRSLRSHCSRVSSWPLSSTPILTTLSQWFTASWPWKSEDVISKKSGELSRTTVVNSSRSITIRSSSRPEKTSRYRIHQIYHRRKTQ